MMLRSPAWRLTVVIAALSVLASTIPSAVSALASHGLLGSSMTNPSIGYGFIYSAEALLLLATAALALGWNSQHAASRQP